MLEAFDSIMSPWPALLTPSPNLADAPADWFDSIAQQLLHHSRLVVASEAHRIIEIEAYYNSAHHPDPFTHQDPVQLERGRWYFHRTRGTYRSGSFKGVDFTFGDGVAFGGFLLRGLAKPDGTLVDGPSLLVDYLLGKSGQKTVPELDRVIATREAWDTKNPVRLEQVQPTTSTILRSARVGLTLKRHKHKPGEPALKYLFRSYRYLAEPKKTAKGKPLMVLGMLASSATPEEAQEQTGCPLRRVKQYLADFTAGKAEADAAKYYGKDLSTADLCRLYGFWCSKYAVG